MTEEEKSKKPKEVKETKADETPEPVKEGKVVESKPESTEGATEVAVQDKDAPKDASKDAPKGEGSSGERPKRRGGFAFEEKEEVWIPKTDLGRSVSKGEITSMKQIMESGVPIKEVGIVNKLLPELQEEILNVGRVQRVTDSGRRMRFRVIAAVGNADGYIGIGQGKGKEVGPAIRQAIDRAKLSIKSVKRGCASWECNCGRPHTVPFNVSGKVGSVEVTISPAPQGLGLVSGEIAKKILSLAGVKDAWVKTEGHTRTSINYAYAMYEALVNTNYVKTGAKDDSKSKITAGSKDE